MAMTLVVLALQLGRKAISCVSVTCDAAEALEIERG